MRHRGPDDQGIFDDEQVTLGMRRLAVIDLEGGRQPVHNEDESVWVVFNGEIYNYRELRADLIAQGHRFYTATDTEVIVHLYEEHGEACLEHLRGMFAMALWDRKRETLFLARDRLGIKPLVYAFDGQRLLFGSEIKTLVDADASLNVFNPEALHYFLTYLYVPAPLTMFRSVLKLPPGHSLTYRRGEIQVRRYWNLSDAVEEAKDGKGLSEAECLERLRTHLSDAVRMRLISDVPLGAFLSGGLDSATLVALMSELGSGPVKTFSMGYGEADASFNELADARRVADTFGTDHREFILKPDVVALLPDIVNATGEPFGDSSAIPTYLISRETRKHVTVALSGIGGDEVFAGYLRYLGARLSETYAALPHWVRRRALLPLLSRVPETTKSRNIGGWIRRFAAGGLSDPFDRYLQWISFCGPQFRQTLYDDAFREALGKVDVAACHRPPFAQSRGADYVARVIGLDLQTYLPDDLLVMGDTLGMANSLEIRVPFCDHKLIEFAAGLPSSLKMKHFRLKYLLRGMVKDVLPPEILRKKKQGFMVPIGAWFRGELRPYLHDTLLSERAAARGIFKRAEVERLLQEHIAGSRVWTHQLWALLAFETWCRLFMDRERVPVEAPELTGVG
jgi:asparagine synthase (glutamine-hydrolysing)